MLSADRTAADVTGRSADARPDDWMNDLKDNNDGEEEGEGEECNDQYSGKQMASQVDFDDDQVYTDPYFGAE